MHLEGERYIAQFANKVLVHNKNAFREQKKRAMSSNKNCRG